MSANNNRYLYRSSTRDEARIEQAIARYGTVDKAAQHLGLPIATVYCVYRRLRQIDQLTKPKPEPQPVKPKTCRNGHQQTKRNRYSNGTCGVCTRNRYRAKQVIAQRLALEVLESRRRIAQLERERAA